MAASDGPGEVLFQRGLNDGDTSMWDDTALVKAYDQAVNAIKMAVNDTPNSANDERKQKNQNQKKTKKHKKVKSKQAVVKNWKVGDLCRAVYSEDGLMYDAVVTSVSPNRGTCTVKYRGYGNEEEQKMKDLMPLANGNLTTNISEAESDLPSEVEGMDAKWCQSQESLASTSRSASVRSAASRSSRERSFREEFRVPPGINRCNGHLPSGKPSGLNDRGVPPFQFPFPNAMPSMHPGVIGGASSSSAFPPPSAMPFLPPPILPDMESLTDEKDALYGMLISWYMSGFHTGYYQCLKQMQKSPKTDLDANSVANDKQSKKRSTKSP